MNPFGLNDSPPTLHSWTPCESEGKAWKAFRHASMGGGSPPDWTREEDPRTAIPPSDAAGVLWRSGETSGTPDYVWRIAAEFTARICGADLIADTTPIAAYVSSGMRVIVLVRVGVAYFVTIARPYESSGEQLGCSEQNIQRAGLGEPVMFKPES